MRFMKMSKQAIAFFLTMTACSIQLHAFSVNVVDAGAKGDGIANDYPVITKVVEKISRHGGGEIYFPTGTYRIANTNGYPGIWFKGISNVTIKFEPGAVLLMDNLLQSGPQAGYGGGHGILVTGPGKSIRIENATVRWKVMPSARSDGDGIRFEGFPSDEQTLSDIILTNCQVESCPQAGVLFMGCSDISVTNVRMINNLADGLHFNACRRVNVDGVHGINNGDDTFVFLTYYRPGPKISGCYFPEPKIGGTFAVNDLNEWCGSSSNATNIIAEGGQANGVRIGGGLNINVSNIVVRGKAWGGIQIDSTREDETRTKVGWSYLVSRGINLSNIVISDCKMGFIVRILNITPDMDSKHSLFGVNVKNMKIANCNDLGLDLQNAGGVAIDGLVITDSKARLINNNRGRYSISNAEINNVDLLVQGVQGKKFHGFIPHNLEPMPIKVASADEVETGDIDLSRVTIRSGNLLVDGVAGLVADRVSVVDGEVCITASRDCDFSGLAVKSKKADETAILVKNSKDLFFNNISIKSDSKNPITFENTALQSQEALLKNLRTVK